MNRCVLYNFGVEFKSLSSFSYYRSRFITEFQRHFEKDPEHLEMLTSVLNAAFGPFWIFDFCIRWNKPFHYHCFFAICTDSPKFDLSIICHPPPIKILYSPAGPVPCFMYEVWTPKHYKISYFSHNASYLSKISQFIFPFTTNANYETKRVKSAHSFWTKSEWEVLVTDYFWGQCRIQKRTIHSVLNLKLVYLLCFFRFTLSATPAKHFGSLIPFTFSSIHRGAKTGIRTGTNKEIYLFSKYTAGCVDEKPSTIEKSQIISRLNHVNSVKVFVPI